MLIAPEHLEPGLRSCLDTVGQNASIFCGVDWFEHLFRTARADGDQVRYFVPDRRQQEVTSACLPIILPSSGGARRVTAFTNFYSPEFGPIARPDDIASLANMFADYVVSNGTSVDLIDLRPVDPHHAFFSEIMIALEKNGFWTDSYFCFGNWYLELKGETFGEYFDTRPSKLRNTATRSRKKLEKRGLEIRITTAAGPELEEDIAAYETIYQRSWKRPEPFPEFMPGLCRLAAEKKWLRLGVLRFDGEPSAAQLWLVKDGIASIFKLAYIQEHSKLSVGTVLTTELMKHAIDIDKVHTIDYLIGDDPYKKEWMTHRRERLGIIAFNSRRPRGLLAGIRHFSGKAIKRLLHHRAAPANVEAH
jgi:hypothetical protein